MDSLLQQSFAGQGFSGRIQQEGSLHQGVPHHQQPPQHQHTQYLNQQQYFQGGMPPADHDDTDSDGDDFGADEGSIDYKCKSRRKATERPEGSDQKRQAFSKRKRGIVLKAYQLYKLTDAKVFMFMVNDKGSSWMYATPGFGASLHPTQLRRLRELAGFMNPPKRPTEVMAHPRLDDIDHQIDDRHLYVGSLEPLHLKCDKQGAEEPVGDSSISAPQPPAPRERDAQRSMARMNNGNSIPSASHSAPAMRLDNNTSNGHNPGGSRPTQPAGLPSMPSNGMSVPMSSGGMVTTPPVPSSSMYTPVPGGGVLTPIMMNADGGYSETMMQPPGQAMTQMVNLSQMTSSTGLVEASSQNLVMHAPQEQTQTANAGPSLTGQVLTDGQGNMYRIVHEAPDSAPPPASQPPRQFMLQPSDGRSNGPIMLQPTMLMMQPQQSNSAPMSGMHGANSVSMGPPPPRRFIKTEPDVANAISLATLAAAASDSPDAGKSNKRRALEATSSDEQPGQRQQSAPPSMVQNQPTLSLDNNMSGPAPVMLQPVTNSAPMYMQTGPRMTTYMPHTQYAPAPHAQLVQMSGHPQHMGGYAMTMPQEMQGYRSYPQGQVMMVSQDWQQGNMGGQQVMLCPVQEQQWQQQ